jgi:hypothetical protein
MLIRYPPMNEQTYPANLVGTWECFEAYTKSGEHHPQPEGAARVVYRLDADGSGTLMPGTIAEMPMYWSVVDGRLRVGSRKPKHQDTQAYEVTDQDTLVLFDRYGGRSVLRRLTGQGG